MEEGELDYELTGDGYVVTGPGTCRSRDIVIPGERLGVPVVGVAEGAFFGLDILSVDTGDGVREICPEAFGACFSLRKAALGANVAVVGNGAFIDCRSLAAVSFGEGLREIGLWAFRGCWGIPSLRLPDGLERIGGHAFFRCSTLRTVELPSALERVGMWAFKDCDPDALFFAPFGEERWASALKAAPGSAFPGEDIAGVPEGAVWYLSEEKPESPGRFWHRDGDGSPVAW